MKRPTGSHARSAAAAAVYAPPRLVTDPRDCYFYHTMDLPGHGTVAGEWDLRAGVDDYLGGVELRGKRVLEVGTASGFLGFHMEGRGAEVVGYDLSEDQDWDVVPYAGHDYRPFRDGHRAHVRKINNAWWFAHRAFRSHARVVYGDVYHVPDEIGEVDVATFGSILLHLRDPFGALHNALRLTRETVVVTDMLPRRYWLRRLLGRLTGPSLHFLPDARAGAPRDTWWCLAPEVVARFVGVLGFEVVGLTYHTQPLQGVPHRLYTLVGRRVRPLRPAD